LTKLLKIVYNIYVTHCDEGESIEKHLYREKMPMAESIFKLSSICETHWSNK